MRKELNGKLAFDNFQGLALEESQLQIINGGTTATEYAILVGLIALIVLA